MKFVIDGREYDGGKQPFIGDLRLLQEEFGFGWQTVAERLSGIEGDEFLERLSDREFSEAFVAWLWMVRLRSGDRSCTRQDIEMLGLDEMRFIPDPGDELPEDGSVPTSAPTGSVRGDADVQAQPQKPRSTKTSKKQSAVA